MNFNQAYKELFTIRYWLRFTVSRFEEAGMRGLGRALEEQYGIRPEQIPPLITEAYLPAR